MLTSTGWWVLVWGVVLVVAAVFLRYGELLLLGVGCLGALLVAMVWMRQRPDVSVTRTISPERVCAGEEARAELLLSNRSSRRSPPFAAIERFAGREIAVAIPSLGGGASTTVDYPLPTSRRGVFPMGPLTIGHTDPLRLMRVARTFASANSIWVHPVVDRVAAPPTGRSRDMDGPTSDSSPRGGVAFHSLREYVPGDDRRLIHWPSTARFGNLMVRNHVVPNEPRIQVVLDTSHDPYDDATFEDAVRVATSLSVAAIQQGYPLDVRTTGGEAVRVEVRETGLKSVLDLFASVERSADDRGLEELMKVSPDEEGVSLAVVTGRLEAAQTSVVGRIRGKYGMVSLVMVGERFGRPAPTVRGVLTVNVADSIEFCRAWPLLVGVAA